MVVGMITAYIDLLSAPLITLGLPLIVFILNEKEEGTGLGSNLKRVIGLPAAWSAGYGLCWACKWIIGTAVLKINVLEDAIATASFRTMGNEEYAGGSLTDRIFAVSRNFQTMFLAEGKRIGILIAAVIIIVAILAIAFPKSDNTSRNKAVCIFIIGLFPYAWFFALSNHSIIHFWFAYRIQSITVFAIFAALGCLTDWKKFKLAVFGRSSNKQENTKE